MIIGQLKTRRIFSALAAVAFDELKALVVRGCEASSADMCWVQLWASCAKPARAEGMIEAAEIV